MSKNVFGVCFTGKNDRRKFNKIRNMWTVIVDNKDRYSRIQLVSMREHKETVSFGLKYVTQDGKSGMVRISEKKPCGIDVMTTPAANEVLLSLKDLSL